MASFLRTLGVSAVKTGLMVVMARSGANSQKNLERDWVLAVGRVERRGLRVKRKVRAQGQLPEAALDEVVSAAESVRPNAEARKQRIVRK